MACSSAQPTSLWALAREQRWAVARWQLEALGLTRSAIEHRLAEGRLHLVHKGVYAVGRGELTREGEWIAALLACGWRRPGGPSPIALSHQTAAANLVDRLGLVSPPALLAALEHHPRCPGVAILRRTLTRHSLELPTSVLEALFSPIAARARLPQPLTQERVNGFDVDFFFPDLGLVVETDGLRHHRTPAEQATDRRRDQAHTASGLAQLRFTHDQVKHEPRYVEAVLGSVVAPRRSREA